MGTKQRRALARTILTLALIATTLAVVRDSDAATTTAAAPDEVMLFSGSLDSTRVSAPKWRSATWTPEVSGEVTVSVKWSGDANIGTDVREANNLSWIASMSGASSPLELTTFLTAGQNYQFAAWAISSTANVELSVLPTLTSPPPTTTTTTAPPPTTSPPPTTTTTTTATTTTTTSAPPPTTTPPPATTTTTASPPPTTTVPPDDVLLLSGSLDSKRTSAPKWRSAIWTPEVSGEVTVSVKWSGDANIGTDVRDADTLSWIARMSGPSSPLSFTTFLTGGQTYQFAVWAKSGTATVELSVRPNAATPPPTTTTPPPTTIPPQPSPDTPNIIIINIDDARSDAVDVLPKTMSWFADQGTTYSNAYVATPSCCPSRATLMTGQFVHNNGQRDQSTPSTNEDNTIQRNLHDVGWFTAHTGKYLHYYGLDQVAPHWDRWSYFKGGYNDVWVNHDGVISQSPIYSTTMTFDKAIEYAEFFDAQDDARPFYLHIAPVAPHKPLDPEPRYIDAPVPVWEPAPSVGEVDRTDKPPFVSFLNETELSSAPTREGQLRLLMSVDDQVDRLMNRLSELGELENTIAIFTSDNGYFWGEHGRNSKFLPYNEAVEIPFLVRWPGRVQAGATSQDLISHVDILPTVLSAAGITWTHEVDGRDILDPTFMRANLLTEYYEDAANANFIPDWWSIRNEDRVYTEYHDQLGNVVAREYYDLTTDPWELVNLLGDADPTNDPDTTFVADRLAIYRSCAGVACE